MSDFEGHTPGPWRWEINPKGRQIQLCGGKPEFDLSVMDFVRWGMNGAQPRVLKLDGRMELMHKAEEFAVVAPKREHHSHWFQLLNHPDLNLMAAAPTLLRERDEARAMVAELVVILKDVESRIKSSEMWWMDEPDRGGFEIYAITQAIAKAATL